jgi:hypothetical protein
LYDKIIKKQYGVERHIREIDAAIEGSEVEGKRYALSDSDVDNLPKKRYNDKIQDNAEEGLNNGREETIARRRNESLLGNNSRRVGIPFSDVNGRIQSLSEILVGRDRREELNDFAKIIYQKPKTETKDTKYERKNFEFRTGGKHLPLYGHRWRGSGT